MQHTKNSISDTIYLMEQKQGVLRYKATVLTTLNLDIKHFRPNDIQWRLFGICAIVA